MPAKTRATIQDIARLAGVSTKSISRVINGEPGVSDETRQSIQEVITRIGYVPNSAARRMRGVTRAIGLIASGFEDYAGEIMRGMSQSAQQLGYNLVLYIQHTEAKSAEPYKTLVASGMIAGLLMVVPYDEDILIALCSENGVPCALIDYQGKQPADTVPTVTVTNRKGVLEATRYLLALGHRRIGFITGPMNVASAVERLNGYKDALLEVGIPFEPDLVVEGDWAQKLGFMQTSILIARHPDLTAVICSDDLTAFGAMDAIKDAGLRVGEDISVIGFDDIPMASNVYPPLTTIRQPMMEIGEATVELLVAMLEGHPPLSLHREFATELVIRHSTSKPPDRSSTSD